MQKFTVQEEGEFIPSEISAISPEAAARAYCLIAWNEDQDWPHDGPTRLTVGDHKYEVWVEVPMKAPQWGVEQVKE